MSPHYTVFNTAVIVSVLIVGCTETTSTTPLPPVLPTDTSTPVPSTDTSSLILSTDTSTPVPHTATATLLPTPTPTLTYTGTPIAGSRQDDVIVTFVHNAGFMITIGEKQIFIDVLYEGSPDGILKPVMDSQPPFVEVDLILATHVHHDHFSADLVLRYMQDNPEAIFISTQRAVDAILTLDRTVRDRLIPIQLRAGEMEQMKIKGIDLEVLYLSHGIPGLLNLGFIITVDGFRLFHTGDMDPSAVSVAYLQSYGLPDKQIDIAFIPDLLLATEQHHTLVLEGIQASYIIPMHFSILMPPSGIESVFPNAFIFQERYESWTLP